MFDRQWLIWVAVWSVTTVAVAGCGSPVAPHEHHLPDHTPRSLWDLSKKIRTRLDGLDDASHSTKTTAELKDLIEWSAEIAADTNIGEQRWLPIYELSEKIRRSIDQQPDRWDNERCHQVIRLCQLSEDAWRSLPSRHRKDRYLVHHHDEHEHDHGDHGHSHDHGDHDHGDDHSDETHSHGTEERS